LAYRLPAQTKLARKLLHRRAGHDTCLQVFDLLCRPVVLPAWHIAQQPVELPLLRRGDRARHVGVAGSALTDIRIPGGAVHHVDQPTEQELPDGGGVQEAAATAVVTAGFRTRHQPGLIGRRTVCLGCVLRR
jgi:hypothetical protein